MWTFILGVVIGGLLGVMMMALCSANKDEPLDGLIRRLSDKAQREEKKAMATDDALLHSRAEGMWDIICEIRRKDG